MVARCSPCAAAAARKNGCGRKIVIGSSTLPLIVSSSYTFLRPPWARSCFPAIRPSDQLRSTLISSIPWAKLFRLRFEERNYFRKRHLLFSLQMCLGTQIHDRPAQEFHTATLPEISLV